MEWLKQTLKATLPPSLMDVALQFNRNHLMMYRRDTYSQEGEDLLISRIFDAKTSPGFYVDIGAFHPVCASNTHLLHKRGWTGINIDPVPGTAALFKKRRPRDINLEIGISDTPGTMTYYMFDSPAQNTFGEEQRDFVLSQRRNLIGTVPVQVERLDTVFSRHVPANTPIDFMDIDVESHELQVLSSNDWTRFRPNVICLEMLMTRIDEVKDHPVGRYLADVGYRLFAKLDNSTLFQEQDFCFSDRDFHDKYGSANVGLVGEGAEVVRVWPEPVRDPVA
ncbi:MAG TPA: FkbM family methyltransferase [Acetobacteraceae bacterium]|jgi:FkbM family methyltransferase|nr:FkbM family methyltransferase [Acetobacteraceae bacterium]